MSAAKLRLQGIGKRFDATDATPTVAVTDFTLDIAQGEFLVIVGPSGCGKTTVLNVLAGLEQPSEGKVTLDGRAIHGPGPERGVMFQDYALFPWHTVWGNVEFGLRHGPAGNGLDAAARQRRVKNYVDLVGLAGSETKYPHQLSGGMRQRAALARMMANEPDVLLMDEPLAALDAERRAEVLPFLARLRSAAGLPILYVTHALDEVDALADRLVLLQAGRVAAEGTVEALSLRTDLPLAGRRDAGALLPCTVLGHDAARGLTRLGFAGGELTVPMRDEPPGTQARVRLRARDVAVATEPPRGLSTQNVLPATLAAIGEAPSPHEVFLRLRLGESELLSRVTCDSVARLGLVPGQAVWAVVKAVTFDRTGGAAP
jgi:molybdate transport system ATP-binding protein